MITTLPAPVWIAHRGYRLAFPENTLAAFLAALEMGAPMIELDVTLSRDRRVVVIHDDTVDRTTDGSGRVQDLTWPELKSLDAGSWFNPRFARERIPHLETVLDTVDRRACINIEIKSSAFETDCPEDGVENQVMGMIAARGIREWILISSFEFRILERLSAMRDVPRLGVLLTEGIDPHSIRESRRIGAFSINPDFTYLNADQVAAAHAAGLKVLTYTVNDAKAARALLGMGVDGIFTDDLTLMTAGAR